MEAITIEQARAKRIEAEGKIAGILKELWAETGLQPHAVDVDGDTSWLVGSATPATMEVRVTVTTEAP